MTIEQAHKNLKSYFKWQKLGFDERIETVETIAYNVCNNLKIPNVDICWDYTRNDFNIGFNYGMMNEFSANFLNHNNFFARAMIADVIAHETRHAWQFAVKQGIIEHPMRKNIQEWYRISQKETDKVHMIDRKEVDARIYASNYVKVNKLPFLPFSFIWDNILYPTQRIGYKFLSWKNPSKWKHSANKYEEYRKKHINLAKEYKETLHLYFDLPVKKRQPLRSNISFKRIRGTLRPIAEQKRNNI